MSIVEILKQVEALSPPERKTLFKLMLDLLDTPSPEKQHNILEFEGIAAHLADDEDPQAYIARLRGEWDERP